jgi:glutamyl-tRNA synthetase
MVEELDKQKLKKEAEKYTLLNSIKYGGDPNPGSILGTMLGKHSEYRPYIDEVRDQLMETGSWVSELSMEERIERIKEIDIDSYEQLYEKKEKTHELPELINGDKGVVMRLAPNPSGPLHIGHTRMAILNDEYVKKYGGKLIVRLEDTNPPTIMPEAYGMIKKDLDWLGVQYHEIVIQSSRFELYYDCAEKLQAMGKAYMCDCETDKWRALKEAKKPCPHRDISPEHHIGQWKKMLAGEFKQGEISMVVKTDLSHPNPAVRDFVAMRIVTEPHPLTGDKYSVYPLYNFSVAVDDHFMEMTHVLRGKDHLNNTMKQEYVFDHFGWKKPEYIHYGLVGIEDTDLSKSQIKASIKEGKFAGWDDVRLSTVSALARRGIRPEAIRKYWLEVGAGRVDMNFSWQNLYAHNRDIIEPDTKRYFFVWHPKEILIKGVEKLVSNAPLHPEKPELGKRHVELSGPDIKVFVVSEEVETLAKGDLLRLKDLGNLEFTKKNEFKYIGNDLAILKKGAKIIHWVVPDALPATVHMPDGEARTGLAEKETVSSLGQTVQFERFGFVKLSNDKRIEGYFTHP